MTDGNLTDLKRVGPKIASNLRDAGYISKRDVLEADPDDLAKVPLIGKTSARTIVGDEPDDNNGRPSKFDDVHEDLLEAADSYLNMRQVANKGGIHEATLYRYLEDRDEFCEEFKRARGRAADRLVRRALDPTDEIDVGFARFLLERSFQFIKTERHEVGLDDSHSFDATEGVTAEFVTYEEDDGR